VKSLSGHTKLQERKFITPNIDWLAKSPEQPALAQETKIRSSAINEDSPSTTASASPAFSSPAQKESEVTLSIKSLQEESLQMSELAEMEKTYAAEVVTVFKQIIEPLNMSYHIRPQSVSKSDNTLSDVVLTPQGAVCLVHSNGMINSKPLESVQSETLVKILVEVIPEVKSILSEKRQKIAGRVVMLEKVSREFSKVASSLSTKGRSGGPGADQPQAMVIPPQMTAKEKGGGASSSSDALKGAFN
jgi:hypothetical protein